MVDGAAHLPSPQALGWAGKQVDLTHSTSRDRRMFKLVARLAEFTFYRALVRAADAVSRLPRDMEPDVIRLYRQNIALKAQFDAQQHQLTLLRAKTKPDVSVRTRAAQVFAFLLTRGDENFQRYYLSASVPTLKSWLSRFGTGNSRDAKQKGGRPATMEEIVRLVILFKQENPSWGCVRVRQELRKMGIKLSKETVRNILRNNGYPVPPVGKSRGQTFSAAVKDALWAMDYFVVHTANGTWAQVLLVMDVYTRELLALQVHDGWDVDALWTTRTVSRLFFETGRRPQAMVHDAGTTFKKEFERLLRVEDVEQKIGAISLSHSNVHAERHVRTVRQELLRHLPLSDVAHLQWFLDEFRTFSTTVRPHQGIGGLTPREKSDQGPRAEVLSLAEVRRRKLAKVSFAHGLLNGYSLEVQGMPPPATAA